MPHVAKNFDALLGTLKGISDGQLKAHFGLYQGYVKKLNEIGEALAHADPGTGNYSFSAYAELKRREAVPLNGAVLHELYFENLSGRGERVDGSFKSAIEKAFGSWDKYIADLRGAATSTHGWVLTTYSHIDHSLHNYLLGEHHIGLPVGQEVMVAFDCWEHAYMIDYGTAKAKYLDAFIDNVDWPTVGKRFARVAR